MVAYNLEHVPDGLCGLLHIPYSFRGNDRLSGKDSDLCLYTPYEIPLQILLAVSAPRHGFPYEILPLHPVLSGSLQSSCYYSASISTIPHFLINSKLSHSTIISVPAPISTQPTTSFTDTSSCSSKNASTRVMTTLSLSIGTTFEASPTCSAR